MKYWTKHVIPRTEQESIERKLPTITNSMKGKHGVRLAK